MMRKVGLKEENPKKIIAKSYITKLDESKLSSIREGFGKGLLDAGKHSKKVVALCADLTDSLKVGDFKEKFEERYFEMGVCEQNMMGAAAGMCINGKVPFVISYAAFNPGRNWDQLRVSVTYSQNSVIVVGGHAGLTTGPDGASHQALEDVSMVRSLPGMTIVVPCDFWEAKKATEALAQLGKPSYLRLSREKSLEITGPSTPFSLEKAHVLDTGNDVVIVACGLGVQFALKAREELKQEGICAAVLNMHTIRPLDTITLSKFVKRCGCVVSVEEHQIRGGLGSEIAEYLVTENPVPQEFVGVKDSFGESGQGYELLEKYGISVKEIVKASKKVIKRKK